MTTEEPKIWEALNELPEVKAVWKEWESGDFYISGEMKNPYILKSSLPYILFNQESLIWVPPLFHPIRPERSLWGIADKMNVWADLYSTCNNGRPDLALAKAILAGKEKG